MERGPQADPEAAPLGALELTLTAACAAAGILPVAALLAWSYRLGSFATWFGVVGPITLVVLIGSGLVASRDRRMSRLRTALAAGTIGGLVGTVGYDAVRLPQVLFGIRPYLPIESYGVLMLNAHSSSAVTDLAGWSFNFINGIGFGISYAMVGIRRRWYWAIVWAMLLESATVFSPFASIYLLAGKWNLIGLAYFSHIFYGYPLGKMVEAGDRFSTGLYAFSPYAVPIVIATLVVGLLLVHRDVFAPPLAATRVDGQPATLIQAGLFVPRWLRLPTGECALFRNDDSTAYTLTGAGKPVRVGAGATARLCFSTPGLARVRTSNLPDAGGLVLVDPEMTR